MISCKRQFAILLITSRITVVLLSVSLTGCQFPGSTIPDASFSLAHYPNSTGSQIEYAIIPITTTTLDDQRVSSEVATELPVTLGGESVDDPAYRLGVGDILSIVVWDHPELTAPFGSFNNVQDQGNVVREDGSIYYPFVGEVAAAGRTVSELRDLLEVKLSAYIEAPQLDVRVAEYRSKRFVVTGAVSQPGFFPVTDVPATIIDAVNMAGGLTEQANMHNVILTRNDKNIKIPLYSMLYEGDLSRNFHLKNGDIVHIDDNATRRIFVLGEVSQPASMPLTNQPMSLTQALAAAGGIIETRASPKGVYVIRQSEFDNVVDIYQLDTSNAATLALGGEFLLRPRDTVYVAPAPIARWNRWVSNVMPSLQGIANIDYLIQR